MTNVLVTGTGAIIGYGILKSLRANKNIRSVATDIYAHAVGQNFADAFVQAPLTSDPNYADWLRDIIQQENIDLIIPGIEQDVAWLTHATMAGQAFEAQLCLNRPEAIRLCMDKITFDELLGDMGEAVRIPSRLTGSFEEVSDVLGLPFLLKPRRGYAGKGIILVQSKDDFSPYAAQLGQVYLAQSLVGDDDAEYTVSAFCVGEGVRAVIALRRWLSAEGATARAETVDSAPFLGPIQRLSARLKAEGPTNFQFRVHNGQPLLLEINPRISSATSLRSAFGYNEALMCVAHYVNGEQIYQPALKQGRAVRYIEDVVHYASGTDL